MKLGYTEDSSSIITEEIIKRAKMDKRTLHLLFKMAPKMDPKNCVKDIEKVIEGDDTLSKTEKAEVINQAKILYGIKNLLDFMTSSKTFMFKNPGEAMGVLAVTLKQEDIDIFTIDGVVDALDKMHEVMLSE